MTEQERINAETTLKLAVQDAKFAVFMQELKEQREDIRRAQEKHDADIKEMNARIESKFDKLSSQIQNLTIAAVVGIGAIVIGGGAIIWSAISSLK